MHGRANVALLELAAQQLDEIVNEIAFVGGATVALLMTDAAAPDVRYPGSPLYCNQAGSFRGQGEWRFFQP